MPEQERNAQILDACDDTPAFIRALGGVLVFLFAGEERPVLRFACCRDVLVQGVQDGRLGRFGVHIERCNGSDRKLCYQSIGELARLVNASFLRLNAKPSVACGMYTQIATSWNKRSLPPILAARRGPARLRHHSIRAPRRGQGSKPAAFAAKPHTSDR